VTAEACGRSDGTAYLSTGPSKLVVRTGDVRSIVEDADAFDVAFALHWGMGDRTPIMHALKDKRVVVAGLFSAKSTAPPKLSTGPPQ
jgi:hypothetical protein